MFETFVVGFNDTEALHCAVAFASIANCGRSGVVSGATSG
jgi:hypothetical protein